VPIIPTKYWYLYLKVRYRYLYFIPCTGTGTCLLSTWYKTGLSTTASRQLRFDTIRDEIFTCTRNLTKRQLDLAHDTENGKELGRNWKNRAALKETVWVIVRGGSALDRSETTEGKNSWKCRLLRWELKSEGVMNEQSCESKKEEVTGAGIDESGIDKLVWGWWRDVESWFQRQNEA